MSTTFNDTLRSSPSYTLRAPEAAPDADRADNFTWDTLYGLIAASLRPFPGADVALSQAIQRHLGLPILYPLGDVPHADPT